MHLFSFLALILFRNISLSCFLENKNDKLDGKACRKRSVTLEEIINDCDQYYEEENQDLSCYLHHLSQYYCCYNHIIYGDGTIEDSCGIWYKPEIDNEFEET